MRKAKTERPQSTKDPEKIVVSVEEYRRVERQSRGNGRALVELLQDSALRDIAIERVRIHGRVRGVELSPPG